MNERIKNVRKHFELNQSDFGKRIGVSRDTIANIEGDRIDIKDVIIKSICREFSVSESWLRTGDGEMFAEKSKSELISAFFNDIEIDEGFKSRFVSMLAQLTPDEWQALETVVDSIRDKYSPENRTADVVPLNQDDQTEPDYLLPNAAHEDNPTPEQRKHADDIMNNDELWK